LAKKSWLITGCSSGLGRTLAEAVLARGDNAVITARNPDTVIDIASRYPNAARAVALDVTEPSHASAAVALAVEAFGGLDILVNNAAYSIAGAIEEVTPEEYRPLFETNLFGLIETTRAALPALRRRPGARIVNISSVGGMDAHPGFGHYSATKFAVEGISEALAAEVGPLGIAVIVVEPGAFRTGVLGRIVESRTRLSEYESTVGKSRAYLKDAAGRQPGDPRRGIAVLLRVVDSKNPPFRLPLGADAYRRIRAKIARLAAEMADWESLGADTDFLR